MDKFLILPGCDEGNRGDQALVWETKRLAEAAGFVGEYAMLTMPELVRSQYRQEIQPYTPILKHPSRKHKALDNSRYSPMLVFSWGMTAAFDYLFSKIVLNRFTRGAITGFLPDDMKRTLQYLKQCKACFVKGGGFIHSYGGITDVYQIYYFLYHINLAHKLGVPVYIMPNSFGPFKARGVKKQVKDSLAHCKLVTARESISKHQLEEIGVCCDIYPDLAFNLMKSRTQIREMDTIYSMSKGRKIVGVTARPYRFPDKPNADSLLSNYITALQELCRWLALNGYYPVLIEHVIANGSNESDLLALKQIASALNPNEYYLLSNNAYSCKDMKKIYSEMYAVIGTRFHSVIFSLSENVPCIAITYGGNKGNGIMRDMELSDYAINMDEVTPEKLQQMFVYLVETYNAYSRKLAELTHSNCEKLKMLELALQATMETKERGL